MRIKTKTSVDVVGFTIKRNKAHDGREGYADLELGVTQDEAEEKFGGDFEALAFGTMRIQGVDEGDKIVFLQDTIKPGSRVVLERHEIQIDTHRLREQPELKSIRTVDGEARVVATVRVPIDVTEAKLVKLITQKVGEVIKVEFSPEQGVLEFPKGEETESAQEPAA